jgi:hypothetical protein
VDYNRVYAEFIKARQAAPPSSAEYVEKHHILPRRLGGGNETANIVRLTAADHFFAHLLLAKIHGGDMWAPLVLMVGGNWKSYKPVLSRRIYSWASAAAAKARSGTNAAHADRAIYNLERADGRAWSGTQIGMNVDLGLDKPSANQLIKGKVRSTSGWFIAERRPASIGRGLKGTAHHQYRPETYSFRNFDGRSFVGTQLDLHRVHGVSKPAACNLLRGKAKTAKGWYLEGTELPETGRGARWKKVQRDASRAQHSLVREVHPHS